MGNPLTAISSERIWNSILDRVAFGKYFLGQRNCRMWTTYQTGDETLYSVWNTGLENLPQTSNAVERSTKPGGT